MTNSMSAVIIGGGVAGASAALALSKIGVKVELFEATPRSTDHGGWVTLGPAAGTALDEIGVGERVRSTGFPIINAHSVDMETGIESDFPRYEPTHRWPSTHVWRRDLLGALHDRLNEVGVRCQYGTRATAADFAADIVIGAEGAHSATRQLLGNTTQPQYTGQIIRYGHNPALAIGLENNVLHFWSHSQGVVGYVGDSLDGSFWFSRYNLSSPADMTKDKDILVPLRHTPVAPIIHTSHISDSIALYDLSPEGPWHKDNTVIIGDAAHALSPAAGRGATTAIEDAIVLARSILNADSTRSALEKFAEIRRPFAQAVYRPVRGQPLPRTTADELRLTTTSFIENT